MSPPAKRMSPANRKYTVHSTALITFDLLSHLGRKILKMLEERTPCCEMSEFSLYGVAHCLYSQ